MSLDVPNGWSGNKGLLGIIPNNPNVNDGSYTRYYGDPAVASVELAAGTYYVRVAPENVAPGGNPWYGYFYGDYALTSNVSLTPVGNAGRNGSGPLLTSTIGTIPYAAVRVRIPYADRKGVIHTTWDKCRWGFM